jgi:uncharacterized protein YgfB (UPF0149 family)
MVSAGMGASTVELAATCAGALLGGADDIPLLDVAHDLEENLTWQRLVSRRSRLT